MDILQLKQISTTQTFYLASQAANQMTNAKAMIKDAGEVSAFDIWQKHNQQVLPLGVGEILSVDHGYRIRIGWGEFDLQKCHQTTIALSGCMIGTYYAPF